MKNNLRKILTLGLLSVLVVGLAVLLTGCDSMLKAPDAKISADPSDDNPLEYTFDGGDSEPSEAISDYEWTFGDGETGSGESVPHTYDSNGEYDVTLTITKENGSTDSTTITVSPGIVAKFDITNKSTDDGVADVDFDGSDSSSASADIDEYRWSFDDPDDSSTKVSPATTTTTSATQEAEYQTTGTFTVVLTVKDGNGNFASVGKTLEVQTGEATITS